MIPINSKDDQNMLISVFHMSANKIKYTTDLRQQTADNIELVRIIQKRTACQPDSKYN